MLTPVPGGKYVVVTFVWSTQFGKCYDCGAPAAYTSSEHAESPENLRCSVCAAYDAAGGALIAPIKP